MSRKTKLVYLLLFAAWALILVWQAWEHHRVRESARTALINRSRDITTTLGLVIRSQRRFGGMVRQDRLEPALTELVKSDDLLSVALLNASGEVVASAGAALNVDTNIVLQTGERWDTHSVTLVNLLDLGAPAPTQGEPARPTIVLPEHPPGEPRLEKYGPPRPPETNEAPVNRADFRPPNGPPFGRGRMDEKEYKALIDKRGLHGLIMAMSTDSMVHTVRRDLWTRCIVALFASVSMAGVAFGWRNMAVSSELQMRLLRASELNSHLKQMNLAAAGLAHETRNPLNIIRGLAQMISKETETSTETRKKTREIIDETDRLTGQLNEFINYSRPREVRRTAVSLPAVIDEVGRALRYDIEEKGLQFEVVSEPIMIEADEQMLRQALFNLVLNATQAVPRGGKITVSTHRNNGHEAYFEVSDNGPGVASEHKAEIFKPYFTTHQKGTGLGLAVVQQIVLAHGWEIEHLVNAPAGAIFRVSHLKVISTA